MLVHIPEKGKTDCSFNVVYDVWGHNNLYKNSGLKQTTFLKNEADVFETRTLLYAPEC